MGARSTDLEARLRSPQAIEDRSARVMPGTLLHIGYPKAASSFLQRWFWEHPQLRYVHQGISGFHRSVELQEYARTPGPGTTAYYVTSDEDLSFWKGPLDPVGQRLASYDVKAHQARTCGVLAEVFPAATVLVITRGFASAIGSAYSQYLAVGGLLPFSSLLDEHLAMMVEFWDYTWVIGLYEQAFGEEQVIVLPFESIRDDPRAFLSDLERRLGLEPMAPDVERVKPSLPPEHQEGYRRLSVAVERSVRPLPRRWRNFVYGAYSDRLKQGGFARARHVAERIGGQRGAHPPQEARLREVFSGRAAVLEHRSEYDTYRDDYFLASP